MSSIYSHNNQDRYSFIPEDIRQTYPINWEFITDNQSDVEQACHNYSQHQRNQLKNPHTRRVVCIFNASGNQNAFAINSMNSLDQALNLGTYRSAVVSNHRVATRQQLKDLFHQLSQMAEKIHGLVFRTHGMDSIKQGRPYIPIGKHDQLIASDIIQIISPLKKSLEFIVFDACLLGRSSMTKQGDRFSSMCQEISKLKPGLAVSGSPIIGRNQDVIRYETHWGEATTPIRARFCRDLPSNSSSQYTDRTYEYSTFHYRRPEYNYADLQELEDTIDTIIQEPDEDRFDDQFNNLVNNSDLKLAQLAELFCEHLHEGNEKILQLFSQTQPFTVILRYAMDNDYIHEDWLSEKSRATFDRYLVQFVPFNWYDGLASELIQTTCSQSPLVGVDFIKRITDKIQDEIYDRRFESRRINFIVFMIADGIGKIDTGDATRTQRSQATCVIFLLDALVHAKCRNQLIPRAWSRIVEALTKLHLPQKLLQQALSGYIKLKPHRHREAYNACMDNTIDAIACDQQEIDQQQHPFKHPILQQSPPLSPLSDPKMEFRGVDGPIVLNNRAPSPAPSPQPVRSSMNDLINNQMVSLDLGGREEDEQSDSDDGSINIFPSPQSNPNKPSSAPPPPSNNPFHFYHSGQPKPPIQPIDSDHEEEEIDEIPKSPEEDQQSLSELPAQPVLSDPDRSPSPLPPLPPQEQDQYEDRSPLLNPPPLVDNSAPPVVQTESTGCFAAFLSLLAWIFSPISWLFRCGSTQSN